MTALTAILAWFHNEESQKLQFASQENEALGYCFYIVDILEKKKKKKFSVTGTKSFNHNEPSLYEANVNVSSLTIS